MKAIVEPNPRKTRGKTKKIKVCVVTGMWGREEIFHMYARGIAHLQKYINTIEFISIVAGSEGEKSKALATQYGMDYIEIPNQPLSKKMDATIARAKKHNPDYVLCLGSDDIISVELMRVYLACMRGGADFIGVRDFYFYDSETDKAAYWAGYREDYRKDCTCGAGRLLSRNLLNQWKWSVWVGHDDMLDQAFQEKLDASEYTSAVFSMKDFDVMGLDIKSSTNMTPFELWDNTINIDQKKIKDHFKYLWEAPKTGKRKKATHGK